MDTGTLTSAVVKALQAGRASGKYGLCDKELSYLPAELLDDNLPLPSSEAAGKGASTEGLPWWLVQKPSRLDVSRNRLSSLPEQLCTWASLTTLDVSHNQLTQLPDGLHQLSNLGTLAANNNVLQGLRSLPVGLVVLHMQCNQVEVLEDCVASCRGITSLDFSNNRLTHISHQLTVTCTALVHLHLANNQLTELPGDWKGMRNLQVLNVEHNQLHALPSSIRHATKLLELHAGFNKLQCLPEELACCTALRHLSARDNEIKDIPAQICSMQLNVLDLRNCELSTLLPELGNMTTLRSLQLDGNPLKLIRQTLITGPLSALLSYLQSRLPQQMADSKPASGNIFAMDSIQLAEEAAHKLSLRGQQQQTGRLPFSRVDGNAAGSSRLSQGGSEVTKQSCTASLQGKSELLLAGMALQEIPPAVWACLPAVTKLDLSQNQVQHISADALLAATKLRSLQLTHLPLTSWPLPLVTNTLPALQHLSLANNTKLSQIPNGALCCCAASLLSLDLSGVPGAAALPPGSLQSLTVLHTLDLSRVRLACFPSEVLTLASTLHTLRLDGNRISSLPDNIHCMTRLAELHLSNNDLSSLPPTLGLMTALRTLTLEGNPLRTIRRTILDRGTPAVLAYLKDRLPTA